VKKWEATRKFHAAIARGASEDVIEALLRAGANPNKFNEQTGFSPLVLVAQGGSAKLMRLLLEHGADPNGQNGEALICCCQNVDLECAALLIEFGADVNLKGFLYITSPLKELCRTPWNGKSGRYYKNVPLAWLPRYIEAKTAEEKQEVFKTYQTNFIEIIKLLISNGASMPL